MVKSKRGKWRITLVNTAEKRIFKYIQDCSGGRGDKFLPGIVLTGVEIISSRYFVFCSCCQGTAPAALSSHRMDGLCFALSSLPDLGVLSWAEGESKWQSQPGLVKQPEVDGISISMSGALEVTVRYKPLGGFTCWDHQKIITRRCICASQVHQLLVPCSSCHRNATRGSYVVMTLF